MSSESLLDNLEKLVIDKAYTHADKLFLYQEIREFRKDLDSGLYTLDDAEYFCNNLKNQYFK